jgi:hypothetical protein
MGDIEYLGKDMCADVPGYGSGPSVDVLDCTNQISLDVIPRMPSFPQSARVSDEPGHLRVPVIGRLPFNDVFVVEDSSLIRDAPVNARDVNRQ